MVRDVRRFAESTKVTVEKTQSEINALVRRHGADMYTSGWLANGECAVEFRLRGRRVRWTVRALEADEREERRLWRCVLLAIKAKLEIVASGVSEFDEEFLSHVVTDTGATVWARVRETKMLSPIEQPR